MSCDFKNGDVILREIRHIGGGSTDILVGVVYFSDPADARLFRKATYDEGGEVSDVPFRSGSKKYWTVIGNVEHLLNQKED